MNPQRELVLVYAGSEVETSDEYGELTVPWDVCFYELRRADGTLLATIQSTPKDVLIQRPPGSPRGLLAVADEAPVRGDPFGF